MNGRNCIYVNINCKGMGKLPNISFPFCLFLRGEFIDITLWIVYTYKCH